MKKGAKIYLVLILIVAVLLGLLQSGKLQKWANDFKTVKNFANNIVDQGIQMSDNNLNTRMDQMTRREHCTEDLKISFLNTDDYPCAVIKEPSMTMVYGLPDTERNSFLTEELKSLGSETIDALIIPRLTGTEADSFSQIAGTVKIKNIVIPDMECDAGAKEKIQQSAAACGITVKTATTGDTLEYGSAIYNVLAGKDVKDPKDASLILEIWNAAETHILAGWGTTAEVQGLVAAGNTAANEVFLPFETTAAGDCDMASWISAFGKKCGYVFPCRKAENGDGLNENIYRILRKNEISFYRTDLQGTIRCTGDSNSVTFQNQTAVKYNFGS